MDTPKLSMSYYANSRTSADTAALERCAEQLATLCVTLAEYPLIRYRSVTSLNIHSKMSINLILVCYFTCSNMLHTHMSSDLSVAPVVQQPHEPPQTLVHVYLELIHSMHTPCHCERMDRPVFIACGHLGIIQL